MLKDVLLNLQVTFLHSRRPKWTQRERRLLLLLGVACAGLLVSLVTTGVFYKQGEFNRNEGAAQTVTLLSSAAAAAGLTRGHVGNTHC